MIINQFKRIASRFYYEKGVRQVWAITRIICRSLLNWQYNPELKFIIFGQGRTGSSLLLQLVNSSENVYCDGEIYSTEFPFRIWKRGFAKKVYLTIRSKAFGVKVYGCRIKIYDLYRHQGMSIEESIGFINTLAKEGWKIIYITRTNKVRQCLSSLVAEERGIYHFSKTSSKPEHKVTIKSEEISERIKLLHIFDEQEHDSLKDVSYLSVNYEKDLENHINHQATLNRICAFLNIPEVETKIQLTRTSTSTLENYIKNHKEVKSVLISENLHHYLHE